MKKKIRYLYWLVLEFVKKNKVTIIVTFTISFFALTIFQLIVGKPFIYKKRIGLVGQFSSSNLPDDILLLISNPLLISDEKNKYTPILLSSWEVDNNYKNYRLILKKNILWNDGAELTTTNLNLKIKDAQIKILDRYIFLVSFKNSTPNFFNYLTKPIIKNNFIGAAGKYKVKRYQIRNGLVTYLLLYPNISNLPIIEYKIFPTEEEMITSYKMGKIDLMTLRKKELADSFLSWRNTKVTKLVDNKHIFVIFFNNKKDLFRDKDFKKAIIKAVDKKKFSSMGLLNQLPISLNSLYYNSNFSIDIYLPDLLTEYINTHLKTTKASKIKLNFYTYFEYFNLAEEISNQLSSSNLDLQINFIRQQMPQDFDLLLTLLEIPGIEDQYLLWHSQQKITNISHYKNERIDKILENLRLTNKFEEKKKYADELQKVFNDDPGAFFLFQPYVFLVERK